MLSVKCLFWLHFLTLVLVTHILAKFAKFSPKSDELDSEYWHLLGKSSIRRALNQPIIHKRAKNVILFVGDGMGISTITAARILKGQLLNKSGEESSLSFENFPHISLIKTYNIDRQVSDSAGTATAFLCGVKGNFETLGVNGRVKNTETKCSAVLENSVPSILHWAIDAGKSAGIVTTTRLTHATPAAGYAHSSDRYQESKITPQMIGVCKDIALQLIEDKPGADLKVILGGGRRHFLPINELDPNGFDYGSRADNRNLINEWIERKIKKGLNINEYSFVNSTAALRNVNYDRVNYLFGAFNYSNMAYEQERDKSLNGEPSLSEMTESAIKILKKDSNGFVLLVEGGRIDHAHHENFATLALYETLAFERAIQTAMNMMKEDETLLIVTADHSHSLTINGYPERGNSIIGLTNENDTFANSFTTLLYGTGPGYQYPRSTPSEITASNLRYQQQSLVSLLESNHGGEDVSLHSRGPMSHLFQGTQEQSYVAHVIAFASCIGNYQNEDHCKNNSTSLNSHYFIFLFSILSYLFKVSFKFE